MALPPIDGGWGRRLRTDFAAEGPGPPTLRGLGTFQTHPTTGLTRRCAEGPANYYYYYYYYYHYYYYDYYCYYDCYYDYYAYYYYYYLL